MAVIKKTHTVYDEAGGAWTMEYWVSSVTNDISELRYRDPEGNTFHRDGQGGNWGNVRGDDAVSAQIPIFEDKIKNKGSFVSGDRNLFTSLAESQTWRADYDFKAEHAGLSVEDWNAQFDELIAQGFDAEIADKIIRDPSKKTEEYSKLQTQNEIDDLVDQGYDLDDASAIAGGADRNEFLTKDEKEQKGFERELKTSVSTAKAEADDIAEREIARGQKNVATTLGESIRTQQSALISQGYTPEEASMMTEKGTEQLGRVVQDIGEQGQILKGKALGELSQFGISANMTAEGLASKLKEIQANTSNFQQKLAQTFNINQLSNLTNQRGQDLSFDASIYGADRSYQAAMDSARMQSEASEGNWWDSGMDIIGQAAGTWAVNKIFPTIATAAIGSDESLKENIEMKYKHKDGYNVYEFNYIGDDTRYSGAMAQEIKEVIPEAVDTDDDGFYRVDYSKLDIDMEVVNVK